jgi:DNA-binding transcriptional LysR family regulator
LVPGGRVVGEADTLEPACELTATGLGITLLPRPVVTSRAERLAICPLSPRHALPLSLIWRALEHLTQAAPAFREHVISPSAANNLAAHQRTRRTLVSA